jgi:uncharacterized protein YjiS (DUF1127 family)
MQAIQTLPAVVAGTRPRLASLLHRWRLAAATRLDAMRRGQRARATRAALAALDDATLRDIGLTRPEIGSAAAELHGLAAATRRHGAPAARP